MSNNSGSASDIIQRQDAIHRIAHKPTHSYIQHIIP